ncbi:hypothetical protein IIA79_06040 [bacterium]|nr:hypothetical protein [bacterium]
MVAPLAYVDTFVFGGVFDPEYKSASKLFLDQVEAGQFELLTSVVVGREIALAPARVKEVFEQFAGRARMLPVSADTVTLQRAYLSERIVSPRSADDALHVAIASVARCSFVVSWNFKHIVNYRKIAQYNAVNINLGYSSIGIHSPPEVIARGD